SKDPAAAAAAPKKGLDLSVIALLSGAIGAGTGGLTAPVLRLGGLGLWAPLGIVGLLLVVSGPSMLLAWLKLRQRNLGPILDANGWAVNDRARINIPFGASLTSVAKLPPHLQRDLLDPFAEKRHPWKLWLLLLALVGTALGWWQGKLD